MGTFRYDDVRREFGPWDNTGPWGHNPLKDVCTLLQPKLSPWLKGTGHSLTPADAIKYVDSAVPTNPHPTLVGFDTPPVWAGDVPAANQKYRMDAMAGHANFVAGVVAQGCDDPTIDIWSHSSAFVRGADYSIVREAAVVLSIVQSQHPSTSRLQKPADVIHVGFAFPLRPKMEPKVNGDFISGIWPPR